MISRPRTFDKTARELIVLTFADALKGDVNKLLGTLTEVLVGKVVRNSIFHSFLWLSHKFKQLEKHVSAAETLAAGSSIDESKIISNPYLVLLDTQNGIRVCVDSKNFISFLSTSKYSIYRSICAVVASIRYDLHVGIVGETIRIPTSSALQMR